jgi:hypothetical protein
MTNEELLELARKALPESLKAVALRIVRQGGNDTVHWTQSHTEQGGSLEEELEQMLKIKLSSAPSTRPDSVDVAATETTDVGVRTTVVQIRDGVVKRVISQA